MNATFKQTAITIFIQLLLVAVLSFIFGLIFLLAGALFGGNFGFEYYFGLPGYEGGGLFGSHLGLLLGTWLGISLGGMIRKVEGASMRAAIPCLLAIIPLWWYGINTGYDEGSALLHMIAYAVLLVVMLLAWYSTVLQKAPEQK